MVRGTHPTNEVLVYDAIAYTPYRALSNREMLYTEINDDYCAMRVVRRTHPTLANKAANNRHYTDLI